MIVIAAAVAALGGVPAQAHGGHWITVHGGSAQFDGSRLTVCDNLIDGNRVRAHLRTVSGAVFYSAWAPSQNCINEGHTVPYFRVCAENHGPTWATVC